MSSEAAALAAGLQVTATTTAGSPEAAIAVSSLSKAYHVYEAAHDRLKQLLYPGLSRMVGKEARAYHHEFWALRDVSFEVRRGETIGVVGRNGSGKSTLLQIICGTLAPTGGTVVTRGRIAALLELGSGFNPDFTGRENVYLNGTILGLSRDEIERRLDEIFRFADIGQYIDQPVKTYSSGMVVRLAFSVAINVDPDILVVDEALAVGDELFQRKCYSRIEAIKNNGATILFVSHSGSAVVELCDRAVLLDAGEKLAIGEPKHVVGLYQKLLYAPAETQAQLRARILVQGLDANRSDREAGAASRAAPAQASPEAYFDPGLVPQSTLEYDSKGARISDASLCSPDGVRVNCVSRGSELAYRYKVHFERDARNVRFGVLVKSLSGLELGGAVTAANLGESVPFVPAGAVVTVEFRFRCTLNPGTYFLNAGVTGADGLEETYLHRVLDICIFRVLPLKGDRATALVDFGFDSRFTVSGAQAPESGPQ